VTTRITRDGATVTLTGDLEAWAERAIKAALGAAVERVQAELQTVATDAEREWYGAHGVQRITGLSGDMAVVTTLDLDKGRVLVSVGSTDTRMAGKSGKRVPVYVHRPDRLANVATVVTREQFYAAPQSTRLGRARKARPGVAVGDYLVLERSERASDGKKLLPLFVNAPGKRALKLAIPDLARIMAEHIERTPNGTK